MLEWLEIARNQAEERYRSLPLPGNKDENYRFSSVALPEGLSAGDAPAPAEFSRLEEEEMALVSLNGEEAEVSGKLPSGIFTDTLRAAVMDLDYVRGRLKEGSLFPQDKFAQLSAARWRNGVFLHVPAGVKLDQPVRAAFFAQGEEHFRNILTVEDGAEAVFVQELGSAEEETFVTELTELRLGKGARLHWVILQRFSDSTRAVARQRLDLGAGSELKVTTLQIGGSSLQQRQEAVLEAEASLELVGAARGESFQQFDFWMDVHHSGSRSRSQMDMRFVMGGNSKGVFNGLIQIPKGSSDCEASQRSRSLLLGRKATVHAIPKLIIQTDAVKCSHGASVSNVNPEQIHYLRSRGIPAPEAERMIVRGFTEGVVERFPTESLQGRADHALDKKEGGRLQ